MSRSRRTLINAGFGYAQFAFAICTGVVMIPFIIGRLGSRSYGQWMASGEIVGYMALLDMGILGVLPWMMAESVGRGERESLRRLLCDGLVVAVATGAAIALAALAAWPFIPGVLRLAPAEWDRFAGPLALLTASVVLGYPLRVFNAVLVGLQDVTFAGVVGVARQGLGVAILLGLLLAGHGVAALAWAAAVPPLVAGVASAVRLRRIAPWLFHGWTLPTARGMKGLMAQGLGEWLSSFGWQMVAASYGIIIIRLGRPEWVPVYATTAKLSQVLLQMAFVLPASGSVALAQLAGEGEPARIRRAVGMMLRVQALLSGGVACAILAFNPAFVRLWVGPSFFGGHALNLLLGVGILTASLAHVVIGASSVLGRRVSMGIITLVAGGVFAVLAFVLGRAWGLAGVAAAAPLSSVLVSIPAGLRVLRSATGITPGALLREIGRPWLTRVVPFLLAAAVVGVVVPAGRVWILPVVGIVGGWGFIWWTRPFYQDLPFGPRVERWMEQLRLRAPSRIQLNEQTEAP